MNLADLKREDPTLALDRLQVWLRAEGNRTCEIRVRGDSRYDVYLGVWSPGTAFTWGEPAPMYLRHAGEGDTLGAAIDDALAAAARGAWRVEKGEGSA